MTNGLVFYKGKSGLNKVTPIVGIIVGLDKSSSNIKTGSLIQSYILVDNGKMPHENAQFGNNDDGICGDCIHRGNKDEKTGSCYVNLGQGPHAVYSQYLAGKYDKFDKKKHKGLFDGKMLRMGSYGDPVAIPFDRWDTIISWTIGHTGYTHQWRVCDQRFRNLCMASCDTESDREYAEYMGWRTFRVKRKDDPVIVGKEVVCPASPDLVTKRQCEDCMACNGAKNILDGDKRRSIVINAHGLKYKIDKFAKRLSLL